jgi:hypothetical protein
LILNGFEFAATIVEQEHLMLDRAAGQVAREQLAERIEKHLQPSSLKDSAG